MKEILHTYNAISLEEVQRAKLMRRVDSKFIITKQQLHYYLLNLTNFYDVMQINGEQNLTYRTLYYDTPNFEMYTLHHNGKKNRYKIRIREYSETNTFFLEIKFKNNKSQTHKKRIEVDKNKNSFSKKEEEFIDQNSNYSIDNLEKKLSNTFNRITLVHKTDIERITIDTDIKFCSLGGKIIELDNLCIIEVKQEKFNINSKFMQLLKKEGIRQLRVSKYCTATTILNPELKNNRFKNKILAINKLTA